MKKLVAIFSCEAHRPRNEAIRQTWAPAACKYADVRFFMGHAPNPLPDEIHLDGYGNPGDEGGYNSGYERLAYKEERLLNWVWGSEYDGILQVDSDTYVDPNALFQSTMTQFDYAGCLVGGEHKNIEIGTHYYDTPFYAFVGLGGTVWMSRKALSYVVPELLNAASLGSSIEKQSKLYDIHIKQWMADVWISQILIPKYLGGSITMRHEPNCGEGPYSWHLGHGPRDPKEYSQVPEAMHKIHQQIGQK